MENKLKITPPEGYEIDREQSTFEEIVFKKKLLNLPSNWQEAVPNITNCYYGVDMKCIRESEHGGIVDYLNWFPTEKLAKAWRALYKLTILRDIYNGDWVNDYKSDTYIIFVTREDEIKTCLISGTRNFLSFKNRETRDQFYENFKDLIEEAKIFL